ncbi:response regulator [Calothrix sp. PCC 6303]|uniref:hybrid sensor histidine kinase/response regulator n=1 Tax=Calothrix sp. PCC 6303 TaxID=1170562 RepID=UPI0002A03CF1|nr:response regulator [Calothrix sp. PCC 6303]AFZ02284.1 response regulator receiver sensor signal transduction histidine kinase [Calothrix sp. PCC 6303]
MLEKHLNSTTEITESVPTESFRLFDTILVIDDSLTNLEVLYATLSNLGYEVLVEMDGLSAIEQVKNNPPDLILLDIMMPKIDGFETCRRLQADPETKDIPIIFMTALTDSVEKVKGLKLGAVDYITKPFQQEEVLARIQVHIKLRRLNQELDEQKQQLEERVQARTAELSQTLEELKRTQLQLVHTEKISSLGQLVAGVAHEVNNPIGFISTNLYHANQYANDLINLVKLYQEKFPTPGNEIEEAIETIDLGHISEDLPRLISSMKLGSDRIRGIMQSLRNYSRTDGVEKKAIDIHEGIETTLMILQHRLNAQTYRSGIQIMKSYGNLPMIECYPGQLNQVFMNLLANAIDAIEEQMEGKEYDKGKSRSSDGEEFTPIIYISTSLDREYVSIQIKDNGQGIPESTREKIFQPFFTTKPEGKGTGLGLSICYQIVTEKHGGILDCNSSAETGTEFIIKIPLYHH